MGEPNRGGNRRAPQRRHGALHLAHGLALL